jgi:formylglycine-generating enzyme required for sulfatase activity
MRLTVLFGALLLLGFGLEPACAEKRVALIIGNSAYRNVTPLDNPENDAKLLADTLRGLGFTLVGGGAQLNLDKASLDRAVQTFGAQLSEADVGLFYYAGHGLQVGGKNYLVPVDANPTREVDVDFQMLDTTLLLHQMEAAGTRLNIVILDACRNNPFAGRSLAVGRVRDAENERMRAASSGLAEMPVPEGTLISFATQPGSVAQDGRTGGNSPYAKALADTIRKPGLSILDTFNQVGLEVSRATRGAQRPWVSISQIAISFYFTAPNVATAPTLTDPCIGFETHWKSAEAIGTQAAFEDHLARFPSCAFAALAKLRIEALKQQVAVVAPPVPPAMPAPAAPPRPAVVAPPAAPPSQASPCGSGTVSVSLSARAAQPLSQAEKCGLKPKDVFKECDKCPEMVVVPAGSFTMGSPASEEGRGNNEGPPRTVSIGKAFAVGKFHVTVDQFAAFVEESNYDAGSKCWTFEGGKALERLGRSWRNPGFTQGGLHPAVCLSWNDANAYVAWLARKTGEGYRLLSEAEWEYAARAQTKPGTYPRYSFGNDEKDLCQYGNGADQTAEKSVAGDIAVAGTQRKNFAVAPCADGYVYTSPVGSYAANGFGLYDMQGNAWQFTEDCYLDSYNGAPSDGSAWKAGDCSIRVIRGGSWVSNPWYLRAAGRGTRGISYRGYFQGFRLARTLTP